MEFAFYAVMSMDIEQFGFDPSKDLRQHIKENYGFDGELLEIFSSHVGEIITKWHHYIPLYDRYFSKFRGSKVRMLEIGVDQGGSLAMWRKYFGEEAVIYGIDINPTCKMYNGRHGEVRIGSQEDEYFLASVVEEMGGIDIVLDDGSHVMSHLKQSLSFLYPLLADGGVYFVEDLHTCYWQGYGGGYGSINNFFSLIIQVFNIFIFSNINLI